MPRFSSHRPTGEAARISEGTRAMLAAVHSSRVCSSAGSNGRYSPALPNSTSENSPMLAKLPAASNAGRPGSRASFNTPKTTAAFTVRIAALSRLIASHESAITATSTISPTAMKKIARNKSLNGRMSDRIRWL
jgi:hypothetical protein